MTAAASTMERRKPHRHHKPKVAAPTRGPSRKPCAGSQPTPNGYHES
ncbi:hypothetical protein [Lysobacter gummosus]